MSEVSERQEEALTRRVREHIRHLKLVTRRLRRANTGLLISGILSSGLSTFVTGFTAAQGPMVGSGIPGWRMACIAGAIFSFGATVFIGLNERLKIGERLASTHRCAGHLRSLEVALTTGSRPWSEVAKEYEEVVKTYPELTR